MNIPPAPEPFRTILAAVLHANVYSGWRLEIGEMELFHPGYSELIRQQWASAALGHSVSFEEFHDLTRQQPWDDASMRIWLQEHYRMYYGRAAEEDDLAPVKTPAE